MIREGFNNCCIVGPRICVNLYKIQCVFIVFVMLVAQICRHGQTYVLLIHPEIEKVWGICYARSLQFYVITAYFLHHIA